MNKDVYKACTHSRLLPRYWCMLNDVKCFEENWRSKNNNKHSNKHSGSKQNCQGRLPLAGGVKTCPVACVQNHTCSNTGMHSRYSVWRMSEVERVETMHDECGCSELQDSGWMNGWTDGMDGWLAGCWGCGRGPRGIYRHVINTAVLYKWRYRVRAPCSGVLYREWPTPTCTWSDHRPTKYF